MCMHGTGLVFAMPASHPCMGNCGTVIGNFQNTLMPMLLPPYTPPCNQATARKFFTKQSFRCCCLMSSTPAVWLTTRMNLSTVLRSLRACTLPKILINNKGAVSEMSAWLFASGREASIQQEASKDRDPYLSKGTLHMPVQMNWDITQTS